MNTNETKHNDTELPRTKNGNKYLIICIDDFSKYVEIQAVPNKESKTIANWF